MSSVRVLTHRAYRSTSISVILLPTLTKGFPALTWPHTRTVAKAARNTLAYLRHIRRDILDITRQPLRLGTRPCTQRILAPSWDHGTTTRTCIALA